MIGVELGVRRDLAGAPWEVVIVSGDGQETHLFDDCDALQAGLLLLLLQPRKHAQIISSLRHAE